MIGALFRIFPHLYSRQRSSYYSALASLFLVLWSKGQSLKFLISRTGLALFIYKNSFNSTARAAGNMLSSYQQRNQRHWLFIVIFLIFTI